MPKAIEYLKSDTAYDGMDEMEFTEAESSMNEKISDNQVFLDKEDKLKIQELTNESFLFVLKNMETI